MNNDLKELIQKANSAREYAMECGVSLDDIDVSLQIEGPDTKVVWSKDIELYYDNDFNASGCVLVGQIEG